MREIAVVKPALGMVNKGVSAEPYVAIPDAELRAFESFFAGIEPPLRRALMATYGLERGREACAAALAWAWENRARLATLDAIWNTPVKGVRDATSAENAVLDDAEG
jgi:hypothetical protein